MNDHVLIATDFDQLRPLIRLTLERAGYQVTEVADGASASAALASGRFACAILDNQMPGMGGAAVVLGARARGDDTPVLLTSGSITADDLPDVTPRVYLLTKPFEFHDLVAAVDRLVGRPVVASPLPRRTWRARVFG